MPETTDIIFKDFPRQCSASSSRISMLCSMTFKTVELHLMTTAMPGTCDCSVWTFLLMSPKVFQHHCDLTALVTVLAFVLNFLNETSDHTVDHTFWHGLTTSGAVLYFGLAGAADDMSRWTAWDGKLSRNVEAHGALQLGLYLCQLTDRRPITALARHLLC